MLIDDALELHWNEPVHKTFYKAIAQFNVQSGQRDSLSEGNLFVFSVLWIKSLFWDENLMVFFFGSNVFNGFLED